MKNEEKFKDLMKTFDKFSCVCKPLTSSVVRGLHAFYFSQKELRFVYLRLCSSVRCASM